MNIRSGQLCLSARHSVSNIAVLRFTRNTTRFDSQCVRTLARPTVSGSVVDFITDVTTRSNRQP